jgi:hypothetical protein
VENSEFIMEQVNQALSLISDELNEEEKEMIKRAFSRDSTFAAIMTILEFLLARHDEFALGVAQSVMKIRMFDDSQKELLSHTQARKAGMN